MDILRTALSVIQVIFAIAIIAAVLSQSSKRGGLSGTLSGGTETFFGKNKSRSKDAILAKITVILSVLLAITTVALNVV